MKLESKRFWLIAVVFLALGALVVEDAFAQRGGGRGGGRGAGQGRNQQEREIFSIVQVGDEVRMVPAEDVKQVAADLKKENTAALKEWTAAKKEAAENKEDFDDPKPEPQRFKVLAKSVAGRRDAEELRAKYQEKLLASMKGKYAVVEYGREYLVLEKKEITKLRKEADEKFRKEMAEFQKTRGNAEKEGRAARGDRPRRTEIRVLPKTFATEKQANEYVAEVSKNAGPQKGDRDRRKERRDGEGGRPGRGDGEGKRPGRGGDGGDGGGE